MVLLNYLAVIDTTSFGLVKDQIAIKFSFFHEIRLGKGYMYRMFKTQTPENQLFLLIYFFCGKSRKVEN